MSDLRNVIVVGDGPVKDGAALHGTDIGYIWGGYNVELVVDYATLHDGWVMITNPSTWRDSGKVGWVKWTRLSEIGGDEHQYLLTTNADGTVKNCTQVK